MAFEHEHIVTGSCGLSDVDYPTHEVIIMPNTAIVEN